MRHLNMKHLLIIALFLVGMLSHAATVKKDTVYTHINSLLKTINTTKKQKATYYVTLTTKDNDSIKLRIDFRKLKANIPIYSSKNTHFDIKAFLSLNQEQVNQTNQKLKAFDDKVKEYGVASKQLRALEKQLAQLKAVDSSQLDTIAIADLQEKIQTKQETKTQLQQSYESLFSAYETQRNRLLGNLQIDYRQRVRAAINEAYKKLKNRETKFQSFDDDALFYDIRINLLKVDATRAMKVNYRARGKNKNVTQDISAGKTYFISHFAEFGAYYEEEQVKAIFKAIKRQEAQRNPYLPYEPFALVTSDKDITQEYVNRIVDYKNYKGELEEEEEVEEIEEEAEIRWNNIELGIDWVSQYNETHFKEKTCWSKKCCFQAVKKILEDNSVTKGFTPSEAIYLYGVTTDLRFEPTNLLRENFKEIIEYIETNITDSKSKPIMLGVYHDKYCEDRKIKKPYNRYSNTNLMNSPTMHFIILKSIGYDRSKSQNYIRYYDVGTSDNTKGMDILNKLYVDFENKTIDGRGINNKNYKLTEIRKR